MSPAPTHVSIERLGVIGAGQMGRGIAQLAAVKGMVVTLVDAGISISQRPASLGVEIVVRYITRAQERYEVRSQLYQAVVELLHGKKAQPA